MKAINTKEYRMKQDFDYIKERASHNIGLCEDDVKHSVNDFHDKKHIFLYSKDLSKGYFIRMDPMKFNEQSNRVPTFKFKEPKIVAEDDKEAEENEKKRMEKFF